jgi:hypothetical protein
MKNEREELLEITREIFKKRDPIKSFLNDLTKNLTKVEYEDGLKWIDEDGRQMFVRDDKSKNFFFELDYFNKYYYLYEIFHIDRELNDDMLDEFFDWFGADDDKYRKDFLNSHFEYDSL